MNRVVIPVVAVAMALAFAAGPPRTGEAMGSPRLHTELEESTPARDTVIDSALGHVLLVFSGPVEARLSRVRWVGPAGDTLSLEVSAVPDQPHILTAEPPPAVNGAQRLLWLTVSADGHQVSGTIPFVADIPGLTAPDTTSASDEMVGGESGGSGRSTISRERDAGPTARLAVGGLGMFCLLGFAGLLWFGAGTTILEEPRSHQITSILGLGATVLLSLDVFLWLAELQPQGASLATTLSVVMETRTGVAEVGRVALTAAAFLLFTGTRAVQLGALGAMLAVVAGALGGHQATIQPLVSLPANGLHLGAAAVWTGAVLLLGTWPTTADPAAEAGWTFERIALRVSSAALLASAVILVTAIVQQLIYLPSIGALAATTYGNLLLAKSAGFLALVGFGAYNRFRLIPALARSERGHVRLRRSVRIELIVLIIVVLVAVALSQVQPPVD